jgi:CRP-like cAMP-binding protein
MSELLTAIETHPFTQGIPPRYMHLLSRCALFERFGVQQPLFEENFEATRFYLIKSGRVALQTFIPSRGPTTLETLHAGDALGWSWLFAPYRWHFSAVAITPVETVSLCARTLREEIEENHDFGYEIVVRVSRVLLDRLQATRTRLLELYEPPL